MKVFSTLTVFLLLVSCELIPPNLSGEREGLEVSLFRGVKVSCEKLEDCKAKYEGSKVIARYMEEECSILSYKSEFVAESQADLICLNQSSCISILAKFQNTEAKAGQYGLMVFIDENQNESIDIGEPYFCSSEVEINSRKRLVEINVEIDRLFE